MSIDPQTLLNVLERAGKPDRLGGLVKEALVLIETVLSKLGEESVAMSFNGGKDCTVLLHIYAAVLYARHTNACQASLLPQPDKSIQIPSSSSSSSTSQPPLTPSSSSSEPVVPPPPIDDQPSSSSTHATHHQPSESESSLPYPPIRSIYITAPNPFPELDEFVIDCTKKYKLDLYRFGGGMKSALEEWLNKGGKGCRSVLVGTRKGDPNDNVDVLAPTDPSWPQFLRVHPILHWTYSDVWDFLLELNVPYCTLYDQGYTSLGSTTNTSPNPLLKNPNTSSGWDPAYKLKDVTQERAGRH
ncbi:FMN adenylyltransferase [Kwoniella mangroviensis CBS 10435]|uniref:FAD synthase n=1 Tax=Kwoniella mangroviensis CBS 10435 TaxID=1331196 RepID=A0A1B9IW59_9TREE|nr:FMN adenylyltransferase [Kwoniella mangroviensis CBS 10435]